MELEQWLKKHDIKKMIMRDLNLYLEGYRKNNEDDFNELFKDIDYDKVKYEFHSVAYVINTLYMTDNEERKYISAKVRLDYEDSTFAEYQAIYGIDDGEWEDDYLRKV